VEIEQAAKSSARAIPVRPELVEGQVELGLTHHQEAARLASDRGPQ